jgi:ABC-2 type transport system permease protein
MKMMFKVAKTELRNLFYSPVAWFLTIAFLVQCAVFYCNPIAEAAKWQDLMMQNNPKFKSWGVSLTSALFLSPDGIFNSVLHNLFLFVPLLTMGLISREINNGTIKLLYSSPIRTRDIVLGKYIAVMLYNLMLVCVLGIFMVSAIFNVKNADTGLLGAAVLGFFLLMSTYTAIGLFMSSLTTYQIVSAIGTFILVFVLDRIGGLWQQYDVIRDLTYFLSISGRTNKMLAGLITTNDVVYFILVVTMFLSFTYFKLAGTREIKPWFVKASRYLAVTVIVLAIGYFCSRPAFIGYWDTTRDKVNTIHPNTQKVVKELGKEPMTITLYCNLLGDGSSNGFPSGRNAYMWVLWEKYLRFKPDIEFKYVYYYDLADGDSAYFKSFPGKSMKEIAAMMADGNNEKFSRYMPPAEIRKQVDLSKERYRLVMKVDYKGKSTFLRTFNDTEFWPGEMQVSAAFKRLLQDKMPTVVYSMGNLERNIYKTGEREFSLHSTEIGSRVSLVNLGFDTDTINLDNQDIPAGTDVLVVADPKTTLSEVKQQKINKFIAEGGNTMFLSEPGKQQMLNPLLRPLGLNLMDGTLVQLSKNEMPHMVVPYVTLTAAEMAQEKYLIAIKKSKGKDTLPLLMPGVAPVSYADTGSWSIKPVMLTMAGKAWLKKGPLVTDSAAPVFSPQEGDIRMNSFPTSVQLTRKINNREQRLVVFGDADFMSNLRSGGDFMTRASFSWMNYNSFPIYAPRPDPKDDLLSISKTPAATMKIIYTWILPALLLILATVLLIRRKRQ